MSNGKQYEKMADAVSDGEWPPDGSTDHEKILLRTNFLYYKLKCLEDMLWELANDPQLSGALAPKIYKETPPGGYNFEGKPYERWGGKPGTVGFRRTCRRRYEETAG